MNPTPPYGLHGKAEAVRARLIQAAKGEAQPQAVAVSEQAQDERQPDLSGESEKQVEADPYARLKAYAKAGARIRSKLIDWRKHYYWHWICPADKYEVHPDDLHMLPEYAQDQPKPEPAAKPWTPAVGDVVRLKSGGPKVTVTGFDEHENEVTYIGIGSDGTFRSTVSAACLTPAKEAQP